MGLIDIYSSSNRETEKAFQESVAQIQTSSKLIIFFASTIYDYEKLVQLFQQKFPNTEVVGVTTVGEINNNGIQENSLTVAAFSGQGVSAKAVLMKDIHKFPVFQRQELVAAAKSIGLRPEASAKSQKGFALVFPNGLIQAEERMLSIVNSVFDDEEFPVFGGTAGDDAKFKETHVSYNGDFSSTDGVVVFVKLQQDFKIYKESIFAPFSDDVLVATKVDVEGRKVYEFNGKKAANEYARILGVSVSSLGNKFMAHPLGFISKQLSVGSPMCVNPDGSISFYCQISRNAEMRVLKPLNVLETMDQTVAQIQRDFKHIEGTFAVNCILRKIQFKQTQMLPEVNKRFQQMGNTFGFCSYGEQLNNEQINQTLVLLTIGTLNK